MQWVFLFAVTYGKYGWDVGEPLSYLSSLGVDLIAMMGIFELENAIQTRLKDGHRLMSSVLNFRYVVQAADVDNDGIAVTSLRPAGAVIVDHLGARASLALNGVTSGGGVLLDGGAGRVHGI